MTTFLILLSIPFFIAAYRTTEKSKHNQRVIKLYLHISKYPGLEIETFKYQQAEFTTLVEVGLVEVVDGKAYAIKRII